MRVAVDYSLHFLVFNPLQALDGLVVLAVKVVQHLPEDKAMSLKTTTKI